MRRQPTFEEMEDKREVRGLEYFDEATSSRGGEWTMRFFQPTLLCKHLRESLTDSGWVLEETSTLFTGEGIHWKYQYFPNQHCEHSEA
jgi:hypothetical protein